MKKLLLPVILSLMLQSCDEDAGPVADYLIFGQFYGFCVGDCFEVYRVSPFRLEKDESQSYFTYDRYEFTGTRRLNANALNIARSLLEAIPHELKINDKEVYGCPDCADQGGVLIEFGKLGNRRRIVLDIFDSEDQNQAIVRFKQKVLEVIRDLN